MTILAEFRTAILVSIGAGLGSVARNLLTAEIGIPLIFINAAGCFLIALIPPRFYTVIATGFLGGFTSFSTFMLVTDSIFLGALSVGIFIAAWLLGTKVRQ